MKRCSACRTEKSLDEFPRSRNARDGRHNECLPCQRARARLAHHRRKLDPTYVARKREQRRRWQRNMDPAKRRAWNRHRKSRRRGCPLTIEGRAYAALLERDPCSYCGQPASTVDHIDPVSAGGSGDWTNLTAACLSCNASKQERRLLLFMAT